MNIVLHKVFIKHFDKRIKQNSQLLNQYNNRYRLFMENRNNPLLKDHPLKNDLEGKRAFSITGDIRVIYQMKSNETIEFFDIGSHNQVYS